MIRIRKVGILVLLVIIVHSANALENERKNEKTLTFTVDMDCQSCVKKIESNIPYEKGVKDLKVSLDEKTCEVTFRTDKTTPEELIKAFEKIGYKAEVKRDETKKEPEKGQEGHIHQ